jgi:hypothetical protein
MRGWLVRVAALLALVPITASADTAATVVTATAGTDGSAITRFTLRFSEPMAPLGGGNAPIGMTCAVKGEGRWVDPGTPPSSGNSPSRCRAESPAPRS